MKRISKDKKLRTTALLLCFALALLFCFTALMFVLPTEAVVKPQISAGADYTLAIKSDGTLLAWGDNDSVKGESQALKKVFKFLVSKSGVFNDRFQCIRIQPFMLRDGNAVCSVGHADMLAAGNNFETCFTKRPHCPFRRNIGKEHFRQGPLSRKQWRSLFLPLSCGGMS